jgi:hypothetical protein
MTQLELTSGPALRDAGCDRVLANADESWRWAFIATGKLIAGHGEPFTSSDIVELVGMPANPNAVGGAMRWLAKDLKLRRLGYRNATRPSAHARAVAVWGLP